jgi:hypothetical protein
MRKLGINMSMTCEESKKHLDIRNDQSAWVSRYCYREISTDENRPYRDSRLFESGPPLRSSDE